MQLFRFHLSRPASSGVRSLAAIMACWLLAPATHAQASPPAADLNDGKALEAFVDGSIRGEMDELHIPSATVAIVKDGQLLIAKGYGHADLRKNKPVDPERSLFRIASISKTFTWVAVMQLVERGKLDLDTDVNRYLTQFKIPATYKQPVTLRHLMTHSAGFEEGFFGYIRVRTPAETVLNAKFLAAHIPARVRPPGTLPSYSNFGTALAGLIVQNVSGVPYEQYVRTHILMPLGMTHTSFLTPPPPSLAGDRVTGYLYEDGVFVAKPYELSGYAPAGAGSSTATDMARYMLANLGGGRLGEAQILKPESMAFLHAAGFAPAPGLPAVTNGFQEQRINGVRAVTHSGETGLFHSYLFLLPEQRMGIFISYVGDGGFRARDGFMRTFFDRYFPASPTAIPAAVPAGTNSARFAGTYVLARRNHSAIEKLLTGWGASATISALPKQRLLFDFPALDGGPLQFAPIAPNLFQQIDGPRQLSFQRGRAGEPDYAVLDILPVIPFERMPWYEQRAVWLPVLAIIGLIFASVPLGVAARWSAFRASQGRQRGLARLSLTTSLGAFGVVAALAITIIGNPPDHIGLAVKAALLGPIAFLLLTVLMTGGAIRTWRDPAFGWGKRVHMSLVALSAATLSLFFYQWNLLGWHFG